MLATLSLGTAALIAGQIAISPLLPTVIDEFSISSTEAGAALTLMWFVAALAMYPGGHLSDHLSRRVVLVAAVALSSVGFAILALSPYFFTFAVGLTVLGLGIGLFEPTSLATVSDLFADARGRAFGIISSSFNVGYASASALALGGLAVGSWRLSFLPAIAFLLVSGLLFHVWADGTYAVTRVKMRPVAALRRVIKTPQLRLLLVVLCLHMFIMQGAVSFVPTMLQIEQGFTSTGAALAFTSIFLVGLVSNPIAGVLGDRVGHTQVGLVLPIIGATGLSVSLLAPTPAVTVGGLLLFAVGLLAFWPVITAELTSGMALETVGGDYGITRTVFFGFGSLGPTYVGFVGDRASFTLAYAGLVGCFLLIAGLVYRIHRLP